MVGKFTAWHMANMQVHLRLDGVDLVGRSSHRVATTLAICQQEINVLTRMELQRRIGRELQRDLHHGVAHTLQLHDARGHFAHREGTCSRYLA